MTLADESKRTASALKAEAKAVKRTATAYNALRRSPASAEVVSRNIVLAYLGGGK